jgi:hypothetical protein
MSKFFSTQPPNPVRVLYPDRVKSVASPDPSVDPNETSVALNGTSVATNGTTVEGRG